jgi:hypothetical protein
MSGGNNNYLSKLFSNITFRFRKKSEPTPGPEPEPTPEPTPGPIKVTTINGDSIYHITIEGLKYYFFGQNNKYVLVIIDDTNFNIYKLENDIEELPNETKMQITRLINNQCIDCPEGIKLLNENNILYFNHFLDFKGLGLTANLNLNDAKKKITELNKSLQKKCSNLSLSLDYVYDHQTGSTLELYSSLNHPYSDSPYSLVLCLYTGNHCISSITISIKNFGKELSIDTRTHTDYERRKYNILLSSIIIIISKYLSSDITYIKSLAINPASAYILMQYLGGQLFKYDDGSLGYYNSKFLEFSKEMNMPLYESDTNYKKLFELYEQKEPFKMLIITVELNDENIEKADKKFNDLVTGISRITCPEVFTN